MKKAVALGITMALWGSSLLPVSAMDEIWHTSEIAPGMSGTAYTVVDNSGEIRDFAVDIVGTVDNGKGSTPMIMAKASGPVVEQAGGILQGMSGSPVYVDGKLVGAVAMGLKDMTPYTFFITPIDEMLPLWSMPDTKNKTHIQTFDLKKYAADKEKEKQEAAEKEKKDEGKSADDTKADADKTAEETAEEQREEAKEAVEESERVHREEAFEDIIAAAIANAPQSVDIAAQSGLHVQTPTFVPKGNLFAAGFDSASLKYLGNTLGLTDDTQLSTLGGAETAGTRFDAWLEPGSPVGVAIVCGDFTVGATGTVTATDGDRILAFGHPFLHKGNVNYFMTDASIVGTIAGQSNGMKIANVGNIIGRVSQDRETGIAGTIGEFPSVVPMKIHVKDESLGREQSYAVRIAYDEDYLPQLAAGLAYAALSKTSDTLGESTATLGFKVRTNAVPSGTFERKNMFYNTTDVGQVAVSELMQAVGTVCADATKEADIIDVQVDATIQGGRQTATLVSAVPEKTTVRPGETVNIKTTIQPYRKDKETLTIPYTVPKAQRDGLLNLDVRGGGMIPVSPLLLLQQTTGIALQSEDEKAQTTEAKLKSLGDAGRNNEIIIAPGAAAQPLTEKEQQRVLRETKEAAERAAAEEREHPKKIEFLKDDKKAQPEGQAKLETNYIIDNVIHTALHVDHKAK